MPRKAAVTGKSIESQILLIRGQRAVLDTHLAALYGVKVRALNQAVKRNRGRFPSDFVFQLTTGENEIFEITNCDLKWRRPSLSALGLHRARSHYGGQRSQFPACGRDEYLCGARICAAA